MHTHWSQFVPNMSSDIQGHEALHHHRHDCLLCPYYVSVCKNILSVKHILLECPIATELFQKNGYDLNAYNNVRDILYNTDVITSVVKLFTVL